MNWAITSITCSRKSSSSPRRCVGAWAVDAEQKEGRIVLGGLADHTRDLVKAHRLYSDRPGHGMARGIGRRLSDGRPCQGDDRSDLRQRISLSQSDRGRRHGGRGDQPIRRNRRHAGGTPRRQGKRCAWRSASSMWSAPPSPAKPMAASTCTPGPEIGVASTKAFTCQCAVLTMLSLYVGRRRFMSQSQTD